MKKTLLRIGITALSLMPYLVAAQAVDPCSSVPGGCDAGTVPDMLTSGINTLAKAFVTGAAGFAVLFVIIGGAQMLINLGDEGKAQKGRETVIWSLCGFGIVLMAQTLVAFVTSRALPLADAEPLNLAFMQTVADIMLTMFNLAFISMCIYAGFILVLSQGSQDQFGKAKTIFIWSIAGALTINVAAALVRAVLNIGL